jgi:hypothetical protein
MITRKMDAATAPHALRLGAAIGLLLLTQACASPPRKGDTLFDCACSCTICNDTDCVPIPGTDLCNWQCVSEETRNFSEIACGEADALSAVQDECVTQCRQAVSNELNCTLNSPPTVNRAEACTTNSPPRVVASQSQHATRAVIDPALSSYFVTYDGDTSDSTAVGELYFTGGDCPGSQCDLAFTWLRVEPFDVLVSDVSLTSMFLLNDGFMQGQKAADGSYLLTPSTARMHASGYLDGTYASEVAIAGAPVSGSIDYAAQQITVAATLLSSDGNVTVDVFLVANIEARAPVADAGADQDALCGESIALDGSNSTDADGTIESFTWYTDYGLDTRQVAATGESTSIVLGEGQHELTLVVADDDGLFDTDTVSISVAGDSEAPDVPSDGRLDLVYKELVREYFAIHGYGEPPATTSVLLSECVGETSVTDQCVGELPLDEHGVIRRVEMRIPRTSTIPGAHERKLKMLRIHPFFAEEGCAGLTASDATLSLPIGQPALPPLTYRVAFDVADPSGNSASAECSVRVLSELALEPPSSQPDDPSAACVLCIGDDCPADCPTVAESCSGP